MYNAFNEARVDQFMSLFIHRKNVYAVQIKTAEGHIYVPKYEVITKEIVQKHFEGKVTLGVYALDERNTVKWLCFDIDHAHVKQPEETLQLIHERCVAEFGEAAVRVEESGITHNFHVWVFFAEPIEACYARALGLKVLEGIEHVELFPKQTVLRGKGLGNLVKLPLGYHQKSGRWSKMNLEDIVPCKVDVTQIEVAPAPKIFEETPRFEGYKGRDPNCVRAIKRGVKHGYRNNAGIVYSGYLVNFRRLSANHAFYLLRLWNKANKPPLEREELESIFNQAVKGGYVFGCGHEYVKDYCVKEGCIFEERRPGEPKN